MFAGYSENEGPFGQLGMKPPFLLSMFPAIFVDLYAASLWFGLIGFKIGRGGFFSSETACTVASLTSWSPLSLNP